MRRLLLAGGLALGIAAAPGARARADEGESALSPYVGFASFALAEESDTTTGLGVGAGLDYERGLTEAIWLRLSAGGALYNGRPTAASGHATAGLTYVFDVLKYVPYAHLGLGGAVLYADHAPGEDQADNQTSLEPLIELGGGLDVLTDPDFSWGIHIRFGSFITRSALFTAGFRVSWRWGFF